MQQDHNKTAAFQNWSSYFIIKDSIPQKVSRPYILSEDRLQMLKRYRSYINNYNDLVKEHNKDIVAYNKKVKDFIATNNLQQHSVIAKSNFENKE
ncbi:hypothetical protein [uncultured Kordia sp.]|uniref:hypothetical protein n=1 Tax=uncultured Kordia sp. TaxID=507699 RepID=UPI00263595DB|nr:hypothetical protein [uncultured Kordia sp.]